MIIHFRNKVLDDESSMKIFEAKPEDLYFKQIPQWKARSNPQMKKHWAYDLKVFAANVRGYDQFIVIDKNGKQNFEMVNDVLKYNFAIDCDMMHLFKKQICRTKDGKMVIAERVSISFNDMNQYEFNSFCAYRDKVFAHYNEGKSIDEVGYEQGF